MPTQIPNPDYISDSVEGEVYGLSGGAILVTGQPPEVLAGIAPLLRGLIVVRYALPIYIPAGEALIPGLFAAEKGGILVGREAWDYLQAHFLVHPRADVIGLRTNGQRQDIFVRDLDFGQPVRVFAYASAADTIPIVELTGQVVGPDAPPLPELLSRYLPLVDNLDELSPTI